MVIKNLGKENGFWFQVNLETSPPIIIISDPKTQKQEFVFGELDGFQHFCFDLKKFIIKAIIEIDVDESVLWYKNEKLHREDGPAVVWADGTKTWFKNGLLHREDGPAVVHSDGSKEWWINNKLVLRTEARKKHGVHSNLANEFKKFLNKVRMYL